MSQSSIDLVASVYGAYMSGDREALVASLAPDVVWRNPGGDPEANTHRGVDAVVTYLFEGEQIEDYQLDVVDILASDARVAVVARTSGRRGDRTVLNEYVQLVTIADGLVTEVRNFYWDPAEVDAFMHA